jgi:subtilisin-like proprotein convertase family protein
MSVLADHLFSSAYQLGSGPGGSNVQKIWKDYAGAGVKIAVIDDGVWYNALDIRGRIDLINSYDFRDFDSDPMGSNADFHGTAVWGVLGSGYNDGMGTAGVSYDASVGVLRIGFGTNDPPLSIGLALTWAAQRQDVTNCSWGYSNPFDDDPNDPYLQSIFSAITSAASVGRRGLGEVIVFSAGNEREIQDETALHGILTSIYTIAVGATDSTGRVASFSTPGSSLLVSAAGVDVPTTDVPGSIGFANSDYVLASGTSFSAPIVSGVAAIMLDSNSGLGLRDVQDILAYSAHRATGVVEITNGAGSWNGGGLQFSNDVGFGIVDAFAAARLSESWLAGDAAPATASNSVISKSLMNFGSFVAPEGGGWSQVSIVFPSSLLIEKATLSVTVNQNILADDLYLISPSGTSSHILTAHTGLPSDRATWPTPFGNALLLESNAFLGEQAQGSWTLRFRDTLPDGATGPLSNIQLSVFGSSASGERKFIYTDEFFSLAADYSRIAMGNATGSNDVLFGAALTKKIWADLAGQSTTLGNITLTPVAGSFFESAIGGDGDDALAGTDGANTLWGGRGGDVITGRGGDDELRGGEGDDIISGGSGIDTAFWNGDSTLFSISKFSDGTIVVAQSGVGSINEGRDVLTGVEYLAFGSPFSAPHSWATRTDVSSLALAPGLPSANVVSAPTVGGAYIGGAGRDDIFLPSSGAVAYAGFGVDTVVGGSGTDTLYVGGTLSALRWMSRSEVDVTLSSIGNGEIIFKPGIGNLFGGQALDTTFTSLDDIRFADGRMSFSPGSVPSSVDRLYATMLGRHSDALGLADWTHQIEAGQKSYTDVVSTILSLPEGINRLGILNNSQFIQDIYLDGLGRNPTLQENSAWLNALTSGSASRVSAIVFVATSQEAQNHQLATASLGGYVADWDAMRAARCYWTALDRSPDAPGLAFWADQLKSLTQTISQMAHGFVASAEFQSLYGTMDAGAFVTQLYHNVFNRAPDPGGYAAWTTYMSAGGHDKGDVIMGFLDSGEMLVRQSLTLSNGIDLFGLPT